MFEKLLEVIAAFCRLIGKLLGYLDLTGGAEPESHCPTRSELVRIVSRRAFSRQYSKCEMRTDAFECGLLKECSLLLATCRRGKLLKPILRWLKHSLSSGSLNLHCVDVIVALRKALIRCCGFTRRLGRFRVFSGDNRKINHLALECYPGFMLAVYKMVKEKQIEGTAGKREIKCGIEFAKEFLQERQQESEVYIHLIRGLLPVVLGGLDGSGAGGREVSGDMEIIAAQIVSTRRDFVGWSPRVLMLRTVLGQNSTAVQLIRQLSGEKAQSCVLGMWQGIQSSWELARTEPDSRTAVFADLVQSFHDTLRVILEDSQVVSGLWHSALRDSIRSFMKTNEEELNRLCKEAYMCCNNLISSLTEAIERIQASPSLP